MRICVVLRSSQFLFLICLIILFSFSCKKLTDPLTSNKDNEIAFLSDRDGNTEIYIMNPDGDQKKRLTNILALDDNPVFSPDGSKIAFVTNRDENDEIYIMDTDGTSQTNLTNNPSVDIQPVFMPIR